MNISKQPMLKPSVAKSIKNINKSESDTKNNNDHSLSQTLESKETESACFETITSNNNCNILPDGTCLIKSNNNNNNNKFEFKIITISSKTDYNYPSIIFNNFGVSNNGKYVLNHV